jgi:hypothetical protein
MKIRWRYLTVFLMTFVLVAGLAYAQEVFHVQAYNNLKVEILSESAFNARFGNNPEIPQTETAILALAQKLYPPQALKAELLPSTEEPGDCGEPEMGVLFAALQNPAVSNATRMLVDDIIAAAIPPLPKSRVSDSGHFKIYYTSDDPNDLHNVTDAEIDSLAALLDSYWTTYVTNFKRPKCYFVDGKARIDILVYYISATTRGRTNSTKNHIELNSTKCVKDLCKRRTTSAHELFHRVHYAYGYVSGTANMKWMTEGTAAWSQKYTNSVYRDYMERMDSGLAVPNKTLFTQRSYDACHFWVFLEEQSSYTAIRDVWNTYLINGKKAKAAVNTVTTARLDLTFDKYAHKWSKANYIKDLTNAGTGEYDYSEDETSKTSCGVTYGPLRKVPVTTKSINPASSFTQSGNAFPYGAAYHVYTLGATLKNLAVTFNGAGSFAVSFIGMKNNAWKSIENTTTTAYKYKRTLTAGQWDKLAVVVMGTTTGGNYSITVGDCISGAWTDSFGRKWQLKQEGTSITGTRDSGTCGVIPATGTFNVPNITLNTGIVVSGCCSVKWAGTVSNCNSIAGTYTITGGGSHCTGTGSFTLTKQVAAASEPFFEEGPDPACGKCNEKQY